jgi:hypothetical protein
MHIILGVSIVGIAIGIYLILDYDTELFGGILLSLCTIAFFLAALIIPSERYKTRVSMVEYEAFKQTVNQSRSKEISEIERAAITTEISQWNQWISATKYKNNTWFFDWTIPDDVMDLQPFK